MGWKTFVDSLYPDPGLGRDGRRLLIAYILTQDRMGWKTFVDSLYPDPG